MTKVNYLDWIKEYIDFEQIRRLIIILAKTDGINYKIWRSNYCFKNIIDNNSIGFSKGNISYTVEKEDYSDRRREVRIFYEIEKRDQKVEKERREMSINFGISPIYNSKTNEIEKVCGRVNIVIRITEKTAIIISGVLDGITSYDDVDNIKVSDLSDLGVYCRIMSGDSENTYFEIFDSMTDDQIGCKLDKDVVNLGEGITRVGRHLIDSNGKVLNLEDSLSDESSRQVRRCVREAVAVRDRLLTGTIDEYVFDPDILNAATQYLYAALKRDVSKEESQKIKMLIS